MPTPTVSVKAPILLLSLQQLLLQSIMRINWKFTEVF